MFSGSSGKQLATESARLLDVGFYRYSLLNRGGDRMVVEYANHLAAAGHEVCFLLSENKTVFRLHPGVRIITVPWPGIAGFLLYGAVRSFGHDLLVVDIIHLPLILGLRNRVVYFAQADDVEYYENYFGRKAMEMLYRAYLRPGARVITVDERLTRTFAERYGFEESRTVVNGIDLETFYPDPEPELHAMKGERKAVFFMARGDRFRKGFDLALEVFRGLDETSGRRMELWVCGEALTGEGYSFPVRNFGVVSDGRLRRILSSADIFFYPSRHEGFGLFPLEAMACGAIPVTTTAIPYAADSPAIRVSPVNDVASLVANLRHLLDGEERAGLRPEALRFARGFDLNTSKEAFAESLMAFRNAPTS